MEVFGPLLAEVNRPPAHRILCTRRISLQCRADGCDGLRCDGNVRMNRDGLGGLRREDGGSDVGTMGQRGLLGSGTRSFVSNEHAALHEMLQACVFEG